MTTIRAAVVRKPSGSFDIEELELEEPRDEEVLVQMVSAGMCHTDLVCRDQWYPVPLPCVFGHEGAGIVEAVGANVTKVKPGDHVVMSYVSCGRCASCRRGRPAYCVSLFEMNFGGARPDGSSALSSNGGRINGHFFGQSSFATHALAYERNVVPVDPEVDLKLLGPLGCGIQTGFGGTVNSLRPEVGASIAIFGTGSVGLAALMGAQVSGCATIIGIDVKDQRLQIAQKLGATHIVNPQKVDNVVETIHEITGGGVEYSLETTGNPDVFRQAVDSLAPLGTCGLIGAAALGTEVSFDMNTILLGGRTVRGIIEGDSVIDLFIPKMVDLIKQGRFRLPEIVSYYSLDEINQAGEDSLSGGAIKPIITFS